MWDNEGILGSTRVEYWLLAPQEDGGIVKIIVLDIRRETEPKWIKVKRTGTSAVKDDA